MAKLLQDPIEIYRDDYIKVLVIDEKGAGGAHHIYRCYRIEDDPADALPLDQFQEGPIQEVGVNGYTNEAFLAIVEHRLDCFQKGPFPSSYNQAALSGVQFSQTCLKSRTRDRQNRGVEGKNKA